MVLGSLDVGLRSVTNTSSPIKLEKITISYVFKGFFTFDFLCYELGTEIKNILIIKDTFSVAF